MNTPAASNGNWTWRFESDALHPDFAVQLSALMEMTDRDGFIPPQQEPIQVGSAAEQAQNI